MVYHRVHREHRGSPDSVSCGPATSFVCFVTFVVSPAPYLPKDARKGQEPDEFYHEEREETRRMESTQR